MGGYLFTPPSIFSSFTHLLLLYGDERDVICFVTEVTELLEVTEGWVFSYSTLMGGVGDMICSRYDILSPGEMQRVGFLRLFYHRMQFAGTELLHDALLCYVMISGIRSKVSIEGFAASHYLKIVVN